MLKKIAATGVLAFAFTGAALAAAAPAGADGPAGNTGLIAGNQVNVDATVCGNNIYAVSVPVLNESFAFCAASAKPHH